MHTWQTAMPRGMKLKSDGFASSLYDPASAFTLARHCAERDLPYQDAGLPVPLETFIEYGLEFQRRFLPDLDTRQVTTLERNANGYSLILDDGEEVWARRVVVATGISNYSYIPPTLSGVSTGSALALIAGIRRELYCGRGGRQRNPDYRCRRIGHRSGGDARSKWRLRYHHRSSEQDRVLWCAGTAYLAR